MSKSTCLSAFVLLIALPFALAAQEATGRVLGSVTDPSQAAIPDAKVTVTNADTKVSRTTTTDREGNYQVLSLPIGPYSVTVEHAGFAAVTTAPEQLRINQSLRVDVRMKVGQISQSVLVESTAVGIETVNSSLGGSVTGSSITNLPLNGRNVMDLIGSQAGATPERPDRTTATVGYSISGGRTDSMTFLLDGAVNNNLLDNGLVFNPNPDAIAEFRVITSNGTAEFGRNAGGIVSVVTKSGTNELHGTAYDYLRDEAFNANRFFNNLNDVSRPVLKRNQFGGTLGGPVVLPGVVNGRDKFFFFLGYQGQRQSSVEFKDAVSVFTLDELRGDFSKSGTGGGPDALVADYLLAHPYFQPNPALAAQGIIDPTRIDGIAQNYIKSGLIPSSASGTIFPAGSATSNRDELTAKLTLNITQKDRIETTLGAARAPALTSFGLNGANTPGFPSLSNNRNYLGSVTYTKVFSPSLLNDLRFSAQRNNAMRSVPAVDKPTPAQLGIQTTPDHSTGPPLLSFISDLMVGFSPQGPTTFGNNTYNFSDSLNWTRGRHTVKAGFSLTPFQTNMVYDFYANGSYWFYGLYGPIGVGSGNDRADFLLGLPDEYFQSSEAATNIRTRNYAAFVQDEWRVTPSLVLTLGLRYEYSTPKIDTRGRSFSLAFGQRSTVFPNAPVGLLFPGDAGAPKGSNFANKNDFAPRFGFAWSPTGRKTSIRGAFGVYFDILKGEDNLQYNGQPPFFGYADLYFNPLDASPSAEVGYFRDPFGSTGSPNPFPSRPPAKNIDFGESGFLPFGGGGMYFVNPHLRTPYIYQYNLSVQHEIARNLVAEASYVGSSSHKLTGSVDSNPFVLGTTHRLFNTVSGNDDDSFSYLTTFDNLGTASYHSLQAMLEKKTGELRHLGSLSFKLSYTYGHSIDTSSGFRERNIGYVASYNHKLFRASSDEDLRHSLSFSAAWDLPFGSMWASGPKRLTEGWTLYPMFTWHTGFPLDVFAQLSQARTLAGPSAAGDASLVRANLVASGVTLYDPHQSQTLSENTGNFWFNPAAFSTSGLLEDDSYYIDNPSKRTYGTLGRNAFRGPGRTNVDLALTKSTHLWGERLTSDFRVEAFNLFNSAQWSNPSTNITSSLFGQVTNTYDPRIIQLALRLKF
jgi:hypothetical protein